MTRARKYRGGGAALCWVLATAALYAQTYREATVTYTDGETVAVSVLDEAAGDIARRIVTRGGGETDTLRLAEGIASLDVPGLGYFRQVRRPYVDFDGDSVLAYRLARRLVDGPVDLYRLDLRTSEKDVDREVDAYGGWTYYLERDGQLFELPQDEESTATTYRLRRPYIGRLSYHFSDCPSLLKRLREAPPAYRDKELATLFRLYGDCSAADVTEEPKLRSPPRFAGLVVSGGLFNFNTAVGFADRIPSVSARAAFQVGRTSPAAFLEAGLETIFLPAAENGSAEARTAPLIPFAVRVESDPSKRFRSYAAAGLTFVPSPNGTVEIPFLITGEVGLAFERYRLGLRAIPLGVVGGGVEDGISLPFAFGLHGGVRLLGPGQPRRRVTAPPRL